MSSEALAIIVATYIGSGSLICIFFARQNGTPGAAGVSEAKLPPWQRPLWWAVLVLLGPWIILAAVFWGVNAGVREGGRGVIALWRHLIPASRREARVTGWDPERALIRMRRFRQIGWASIPVLIFGILAFVPFLFIAFVRRRVQDWVVFTVYLAADIAAIALAAGSPNAAGILLLAIAAAGTVHVLIELRPGSVLAVSRDVYAASAADPGQPAATVLSWDGAEMVLGRGAEGSQIFTGDRSVSKRHAVLRRDPSGACVVEDLKSRAGTFVNGERITGPTQLHSGDELRLGQTRLHVRSAAPGAVPSAAGGTGTDKLTQVPAETRYSAGVPGALRADHVWLTLPLPGNSVPYGDRRQGWLILTEAGEVRFYGRLPANLTEPPLFSARSPAEFFRKIGPMQVAGRFGKMNCNVWFSGEPAPERRAEKIEEEADQLGNTVSQIGADLGEAFPRADVGMVNAEGDLLSFEAKAAQLIRMARNTKRRVAARNAWYPVLLGRRPWPMINAVSRPEDLVLEIPQARQRAQLPRSAQTAIPAVADATSPAPSQPVPAQVPPAHLARILTGHAGPVTGVAFSPDGCLLATSSGDHTTRVWDPATGKHLRTLTGRILTGRTGAVHGVAFSPDGCLLATASDDHTARLWNPATGQHLRKLAGHSGAVNRVAFSPDGRLLATAGSDGTARVWDPATGEQLRKLTGHPGGVFGVAFSPDGRLLATAGYSTALLWDPATGEQLRKLTVDTAWVYGVAFSPDGRLLATASDDGTVRLWDPATGEQLRKLTGHSGEVFQVAFSPDGLLLATVSWDNTARVWDPATGDQLRKLTGHTGAALGVAFSPNGLLLATANGDRTARVWD